MTSNNKYIIFAYILYDKDGVPYLNPFSGNLGIYCTTVSELLDKGQSKDIWESVKAKYRSDE